MCIEKHCFHYNEANQKVHFLLTLILMLLIYLHNGFCFPELLSRVALGIEPQLLQCEFVFYLEYHAYARTIIRAVLGNFSLPVSTRPSKAHFICGLD